MTKDEALKLALEALEEAWYHVGTFQPTEKAIDLYDEARTAIKEALAHPEQEPVAWMNDSTPSGIFARHMEGARNFGCTIPLYTTPPQRTWVDLTRAQFAEILCDDRWQGRPELMLLQAQSKLKEKNNG